MSAPVFLTTISLVLGTVLAVFALRALAQMRQARAAQIDAEAWRRIAQQAAEAESATAASLAAVQSALTQIQARLAAVETILKAVE